MRDSDIEVVELTDAERETFEEMSLAARDRIDEVVGDEAEQILSTLLDEIERAEQAAPQ